MSDDGKKTYLAFIILYYCTQLLPMLSVILYNPYSDEHRSRCSKFVLKTILLLSTTINGQYMYIAFGPLCVSELSYYLKSALRGGILASRLSVLVL